MRTYGPLCNCALLLNTKAQFGGRPSYACGQGSLPLFLENPEYKMSPEVPCTPSHVTHVSKGQSTETSRRPVLVPELTRARQLLPGSPAVLSCICLNRKSGSKSSKLPSGSKILFLCLSLFSLKFREDSAAMSSPTRLSLPSSCTERSHTVNQPMKHDMMLVLLPGPSAEAHPTPVSIAARASLLFIFCKALRREGSNTFPPRYYQRRQEAEGMAGSLRGLLLLVGARRAPC